MFRIFKENDFMFLKDIISEYMGHEITDSDLKNRMEYIRNSFSENLYIFEDNGLSKAIIATRIRENIEENSKFLEISLIITKSEFRNQGIGKQMISFAEEKAKEIGCIGLWLVSGFGREEEAHKFYKNLEFVITGYRFRKVF